MYDQDVGWPRTRISSHFIPLACVDFFLEGSVSKGVPLADVPLRTCRFRRALTQLN